MNKPHQSFSVKECKIQASILLKSLRSNDPEQTKQAAKRFQRLPEWVNLSLEAQRTKRHGGISIENGCKSKKRAVGWVACFCNPTFLEIA